LTHAVAAVVAPTAPSNKERHKDCYLKIKILKRPVPLGNQEGILIESYLTQV